MTSPLYHCSQADLYAVMHLGWQNFFDNLTPIAALSGKYTIEYGTAALNEVLDAEEMPDRDERNSESILLRIELAEKGRDCTQKWKMLKIFIAAAFPPNTHTARWNAAGWRHYLPATNENWPSVSALMKSGSNFIAANLAALQADNNMPKDFDKEFTALKDGFAALYTDFLSAELRATTATEAKIKANNASYEKMMQMFLVGQEAFDRDEAKRKLFVFSELLLKVAGSGTPGVSGQVLDAESSLPLSGVLVTIENSELSAITDGDGRFVILRLAANAYNLKFASEGFASESRTVVVETGKVTRMGAVLLQPLPDLGAVAGERQGEGQNGSLAMGVAGA